MSKQKTILVVEDEKDLVDLLKIRLESLGYKVIYALDGQEGLDVLKSQKPDLVILDIMMPKLDGISVLLKLKANKQTKDIPVLILSVIGEEEEKSIAKKLGAVAYVNKPFSNEVLISKIKSILQ